MQKMFFVSVTYFANSKEKLAKKIFMLKVLCR